MKNARLYFNDLGFDIETISDTIFLAKKKGSHFMFLKFTDYYFVRFEENLSVEKIKECHDTSKIIANKDFKLPKAIRLNIPNINTLFVVNKPLSDSVISFVKNRNVNVVGGEQDSLFILNNISNEMHCAGKDYSHVSGQAKLIWGNTKEFKTLNGHNRSYYLMTGLIKYLNEKI